MIKNAKQSRKNPKNVTKKIKKAQKAPKNRLKATKNVVKKTDRKSCRHQKPKKKKYQEYNRTNVSRVQVF